MTDPAIIASNLGAAPISSPTSRLVEDVVAALAAEISRDLDVAEMPDKPGDYDLGERPGAVLVHYRGSKYQKGRPSQPRELTFDIHLRLRGQAGRFGFTHMIDAVADCLQDRQFQGSTGFQLESDGLVQEHGGLWDYVVSFTTTMPRAARRQPDWRPY
ncbi:Gp37 family protein [Bosea sp. TWI1241]|uniref:Gp37 family protein n=1 Tax=Bosea sp. TWI1241 TaxID=3148904 RepID=UPI00320A728B